VSDRPDLVRRDRKSEEFFEPVAEVIARELFARISVRDQLDTVEAARDVAGLIADAVLDRFVVRPRAAARADQHVARADTADSSVILDVRDLSVAYGAKKAVETVSFRIAQGEIFGLLGPNGAGKTSTLSAIEGLIKPQAGPRHAADV
jgi:ABC-type glutathione transport system ATPase component